MFTKTSLSTAIFFIIVLLLFTYAFREHPFLMII